MLELRNVTIAFGDAGPALAEGSLDIGAGERMLVCGAAGSGKTTLLSAAAGIIPRLVTPHSFAGTVTFEGRPVSTMSRDELFTAISIVSQNVEDQLWDLSVEDLIAFPLENRGMAKARIRERLQELLGELELDALRGRRVLTLSGGERRMVAIAAAIAAAPRLLALDEPTTGLDPAARQRLVRILRKLGAEIPALLISEQDPASVREVVDRVALLSSGTLSGAHPAASLMQAQAPWLEAGVLPPRLERSQRKTYATGDSLLAVSGLKTVLTRKDGQPVLEDVGLEIRAGEAVALIGKNGAGKTTLFQSILGLARIAAGRIVIRGEEANGWTAARRARSIAYLPQNMRRILFNMTVLEEVTFAITAASGSTRDPAVLDRALACLAKYGLGEHAETNPFALSARQQALLGLACAEAAGAALAILDEPLLARDLNGRRMLELFLGTALSSGRAILLISHDLELVEDVSSRVLVLDQGRVVFDGDTDAAWQSAAYRSLGWPAPRADLAMEAMHAHS